MYKKSPPVLRNCAAESAGDIAAQFARLTKIKENACDAQAHG